MRRREFLHTGALAFTAAVTGPAVADSSQPAGAPGAEPTAAPGTFELDEATITGLQEAMKSGRLTSRSISERYLQRIHEIDRNGPTVNSVIEINPDAVEIADALDRERKEKGSRG